MKPVAGKREVAYKQSIRVVSPAFVRVFYPSNIDDTLLDVNRGTKITYAGSGSRKLGIDGAHGGDLTRTFT